MVTVNDMLDSPIGRALTERAKSQREETRRIGEALFRNALERSPAAPQEAACLAKRGDFVCRLGRGYVGDHQMGVTTWPAATQETP